MNNNELQQSQGSVNYLQQGKAHCFICHQDYFGDQHYNCQDTMQIGITAENCPTCKRITDAIIGIAPKSYKYCPHCGKEL